MRLTDDELLVLLDDIESDRVERKESFKGEGPKRYVRPSALLPMTCLVMTGRA